MVVNVLWQKSCPALPKPSSPPVFQLLECSASPAAVACSGSWSLTCLKQFLPSTNTEGEGEGEGGCLGLSSTAEHCGVVASLSLQSRDVGGDCAAGNNAEGCSGFCRASPPFQSHSAVKRWELVLLQPFELLPEEQSKEARQKCENLHHLLRGILCCRSCLCRFSFCSSSIPAGSAWPGTAAVCSHRSCRKVKLRIANDQSELE